MSSKACNLLSTELSKAAFWTLVLEPLFELTGEAAHESVKVAAESPAETIFKMLERKKNVKEFRIYEGGMKKQSVSIFRK